MIYFIVIAAFIILLIVISFLMRKSTLSQLSFLKNEKEIFVEEKVKVISHGIGPEPVNFPNCKIIVTNERLIITQKILFQKDHKVHYVLWKSQQDSEVKNGIVHMMISSENISLNTKGNIEILNMGSLYIRKIEICSEKDDFIKILKSAFLEC